MKKRYRIVIEFVTDRLLAEGALDGVAEDMSVQLESLEDGTHDRIVVTSNEVVEAKEVSA